MGVFFSKYIVKKNLEFFKGGGRGMGSFFIILRYLKISFKKKFCLKNCLEIFFIFRGRGGDRGNLVHFKNSFKIEGTTSPQQRMCYFVPIKRGVANPHPLK